MNRLKELRNARGLTIRALEEKVNISHTQITHIENGKRNLTTKNAKILADFFGVSVDYLLGKSAEEMYNGFVNSLQRDFVGEEMFSDGDVVQAISPEVSEPIRSKIRILFLLQDVNNPSALDVITGLVKHWSAVENFSTDTDKN